MTPNADPTRPARRPPRMLIVVGVVAVILLFGAWLAIRLLSPGAPNPTGSAGSVCLPAPLIVSNPTPHPGETIELSSPGVGCDLAFPGTAHYDVALGLAGHSALLPLARAVQVRGDGGFATELTIPADASPGEAYIIVSGSAHDRCDETESCAGYRAEVTILAVD